MIEVTEEDFSIDAVVRRTLAPSMGAAVMFLGVVRDRTDGRPVDRLEFESDDESAVSELQAIRQEAIERFGVTEVSIVHRKGRLEVGEDIVLIVVGAPHRDAAFAGCRYVIEELKKRALIWKKEFIDGVGHWVGGVS